MAIQRREFLEALGVSAALGVASLAGCTSLRSAKSGRVVVIGGGYAGATAARYIALWAPTVDVTLVERNAKFVSCPLSNLVLGGSRSIGDLTQSYGDLASKHDIRLLRDEAVAIDPVQRLVRLASGGALGYDRLIVAPGIDFLYEQIPGLNSAAAQEQVPHAWKAGQQTVALRKRLEAMPDGGVYALHIPKVPFRCPPGPYERACQVAFYFKQAKPKSKVLVLDANDEIVSKKALFAKVWKENYPGIVEYRPGSELIDVDARLRTVKLTFEDVKADVLNVVPPQRAGNIAQAASLITANARWCEVDFLTYESAAQKNIHVLGDAIQPGPAMPKSAHMANGQAKVCAAAVVAMLAEQPVNPNPMLTSTCYSFVSDKLVIHVASVHRYDAGKKTMVTVEGSGGLSSEPNELEAQYALGWARNIWADTLG